MEADHSSPESSKKRLVEETNRCVSCGLCLPHCPTYRLLKSEADSPRGRIAMMNGVATGRIPMNSKFKLHLDRCLTCRACEAVCPNHVAYGEIIDEARNMMRTADVVQCKDDRVKFRQQFLLWILNRLVARPKWIDHLRLGLSCILKSGVLNAIYRLQQRDSQNRTGLHQLLMQLPPVEFPYRGNQKKKVFPGTWQTFYPAEGEVNGTVGLFLGCIARLTDTVTLNASIQVLNRLGYHVFLPAAQTCCGALQQHAGECDKAAQLRQVNSQAFKASDLLAVISTASGCGAQLSEYASYNTNQQSANETRVVFPKVSDISQFLVAAKNWEHIVIKALDEKIAVHDPCSLRHTLRDHHYPYQLIQKIPGARPFVLADNDQCCGAAGTYFIRQPELAGRLLENKINVIVQSGAKILVTSNVGCSMHIAGRLREMGSDIEVMHPVTLLARQMQLSIS